MYDPDLVKGDTLLFALAHETAHHLNGDPISGETPGKLQELRADYFAALYLTRPPLNWTRGKLVEALKALPLPKGAKGIYPSIEERQVQVNAGYAAEFAQIRANSQKERELIAGLFQKLCVHGVLWEPKEWESLRNVYSSVFNIEDDVDAITKSLPALSKAIEPLQRMQIACKHLLQNKEVFNDGANTGSGPVNGDITLALCSFRDSMSAAAKALASTYNLGRPCPKEFACPISPSAEYRVIVDGKMWDLIRSSVVIYDGRYSLLERVRVFEPSAKVARVVFVVTGNNLAAAHLNFRGEPPNQSSVRGIAIQTGGDTFEISDEHGSVGLMRLIVDHMEMLKEGKGVYYLEVVDSSGRVFDFDVYEAEWKFEKNSTFWSGGYSKPSHSAK